ncbi:MAG: hypothetical protein K6T90_17575 [Leptolyngbyaceae cyanobacterium HOT.MB2.61]|nr:hypothetical protein [Leptolyngbyaceae cyanobacterium HOT.MB2.61]
MSANAPVPNASSPDGTLSGTWQVEQTVLREVDVAGNVTIGNVTYLRAYQQRRLRVLEKERP